MWNNRNRNFSWTYYGQEDNSTVLIWKRIIRIYDDPKYQIKIIDQSGKIEELVEAIQTNDNQTKLA